MANFGDALNEQDYQERALEINRKKLLEISFISEQREEDLKELQVVNQKLRTQLEQAEGESQRLQVIVEQYEERLSVLPALLAEKSNLSEEKDLLGGKLSEFQEKFNRHALENQRLLESHANLKNDHSALVIEHQSLVELSKEQQNKLDRLQSIESNFTTCAQELKIAHTENANLQASLEEFEERQKSDKIELDSAKKEERHSKRVE